MGHRVSSKVATLALCTVLLACPAVSADSITQKATVDTDRAPLVNRLIPCRAETWRLSRAKSLEPAADKSKINSKILEACVQVNFEPQRALKKVETTYFAQNNRVARRLAKMRGGDAEKSKGFGKLRKLLPSFQKKTCVDKTRAKMSSQPLKTKLSEKALDEKLRALCEAAHQNPDEAFVQLKKALERPDVRAEKD